MNNLPTLADQRAAGLETTITLAILTALRQTSPALKAARLEPRARIHRRKR